jgi:predicted ATPase
VRGTNLFVPLSSFVGRDADLAALSARFASGAHLVTVVGPPGIGKTRLLQRFGETAAAPFLDAGGVWFCDLVEARTAHDLCRATVTALGMRLPAELDGAALRNAIASILSESGPTLLLCDNFEQLDDEAAKTLEVWCRVAPNARVLTSSRRALGVVGETVFEIEPLGAEESLQLFVERARAAGRPVEPDDLDASAALVKDLDGIPLAIELAAARARVASAAELRERLARGHPVLSPVPGSRIRSLEDAVRRSWELLEPFEQDALAQCAYFASDFSLAAAEAVIDLTRNPGTPPVLDVLARLREHSLLAQRRGGTETRFRMYASLRSFARERLRAEFDVAGVARRHREHYVTHGFAWAQEYWRSGAESLLRRLSADRENLALVLRALREQPVLDARSESDLARVVFALEPPMAIDASERELFDMLDAGVAAAKSTGDDALAARLLVTRGDAYGIHADNERAFADLRAASELARTLQDEGVQAEAEMLIGVRLRQQGNVEEALAATLHACDLAGENRWPHIEGSCAVVTGMLLGELGRARESRATNLRARDVFAAAGDHWSEALAIANIAMLDHASGDFDAARDGFDAANALFHAFGDRRYEGRYQSYRATVDHECGRYPEARERYRHALVLMHGLRMPHNEGLCRASLGALLAATDAVTEARAELDRAEAILARVDAPMFRVALDLHRKHIDLASAREAERAGDATRARSLRETARACLQGATHTDRSEDIRFAARLLARALDAASPRPNEAGAELVVGPGARTFRLGEGEIVDLARRGSLHRILDWLVETHDERPGTRSDWQILLAKGWPGERVLAEAGATRVRVAIATLRKLGLAAALETRDDGYLLSERLSVRRADFNER